jgi:hypothetical protein
MLVEIWEWLRGYDKWVKTNAVVSRSGTETVAPYSRGSAVVSEAGDVIEWTDQTGEKQYASFNAPEGSKLFQLIDGDKAEIRYNPVKADEFYYRDLLQMKVRQAAMATLALGSILLLFGSLLLPALLARQY